MIRWLNIAFRNILRNKHRSFVTLFAIAIGFSSISLFRGYTNNTYEGIRESAIRGEGLGHLAIYKKGWHEHGKLDPQNYLLSSSEIRSITELVQEEEEVIIATPQLHVSGLVSNGEQSTIFIGKGVSPQEETVITGDFSRRRVLEGKPLHKDRPYAIEMAQDLAKQLNFSQGSEGVIMASTLDGQMNALNIEVAGVYDTGTSATNDKFLRIPLPYAQELYETDKADQVIILLEKWQQTKQLKTRLLEKLTNHGLFVEIKTWRERSQFYTKVKGMFDMIFTFILSIVLVIVVMSVANTMGMAVIERTREVGTLRALGLKQRGVTFLFALEGALLGGLGCLIGALVTVGIWALILEIGPTYTPPGSSSPVPLIVSLMPFSMGRLMLWLMLLSLLAAILPARRAAKRNVVESLAHV